MSKYVIDDTTLTAIGDAVRAKGGTTELIPVSELADAITNLPSGGETEDFWDYIQNYGKRTNYGSAFAYTGFKVIKPKYGFENLKYAYNMCADSKVEEIEIYNTINGEWSYAFSNCTQLLKVTGHINPKATHINMAYMFNSCSYLKDAGSLI